MAISRSELKTIRQQAVESLQDILGDEYLVQAGSGTYGDMAEFKLKVFRKGANGKVVTDLERDFRNNAALLGLDPDDFGATFKSNGSTYVITGLKPRNRKYPIIAKNVVTQANYKFHENTVKFAKGLGGDYWKPAE